MDRGVEGVGIAVGEHPFQTRILKHAGDLLYLFFHSLACEEPLVG